MTAHKNSPEKRQKVHGKININCCALCVDGHDDSKIGSVVSAHLRDGRGDRDVLWLHNGVITRMLFQTAETVACLSTPMPVRPCARAAVYPCARVLV